jgi:hypothetical protein
VIESLIDHRAWDRAGLVEEAQRATCHIIIVPIETDAGRDTGGEHALVQISSDTGGKYYYAKSLAQLDDAFQKISEELRTQYLLAYYPSQHYSGSEFRQLRVGLTNAPPGGPSQSHYRAGVLHAQGVVLRRAARCLVIPPKWFETPVVVAPRRLKLESTTKLEANASAELDRSVASQVLLSRALQSAEGA